MGIRMELGIFLLAIAFGLWQIHDVKKLRKTSQLQRAQRDARKDQAEKDKDTAAADAAPPAAHATKPSRTDVSGRR